jgi:hypothetical protein
VHWTARAALVLLLLPAGVARAQVTTEPVAPYPDPSKFARGFYGEAEVGALVFMGEASAALSPGTAVGARVGLDLFSFFAVQLHALGSTHTTKFADMPQAGQLLQLYQVTAEAKVTARISQFSVYGMAGAGLVRLSSNLLGTTGFTDPDQRSSRLLLGGLGVDYHTMSRHFSFGLSGTFAKYVAVFTLGAVATTAYVRYTL